MSRVANGITIIEVPFFLMMATGIMMLTIGWYNYRANRINSLKMFIISLALFWFGCALFALGAHWYFSIDEPKKHQLQSLPQNIFYKSVLCNDSITTNYFLTCELSRKPLQITCSQSTQTRRPCFVRLTAGLSENQHLTTTERRALSVLGDARRTQ